MRRPVTVLIVDDHPLIRQGLAATLGIEQSVSVVGEAEDGQTALERAVELEPDVVLMDYNMPGMNGADATRSLLACLPATVVIAVTSDDQPHVFEAMQSSGATNFFLKGGDPASLISAILQAAHDE